MRSFKRFVHITKLHGIISHKTPIFIDIRVCIHSQGTEILEIIAQILHKGM
jgi:hypothetical protein